MSGNMGKKTSKYVHTLRRGLRSCAAGTEIEIVAGTEDGRGAQFRLPGRPGPSRLSWRTVATWRVGADGSRREVPRDAFGHPDPTSYSSARAYY